MSSMLVYCTRILKYTALVHVVMKSLDEEILRCFNLNQLFRHGDLFCCIQIVRPSLVRLLTCLRHGRHGKCDGSTK